MHHTTRSTQSDLQLLDLLDTLPDALFIVNDEQRIQYANAAAEKRTGTLQQDLIGNSLWQSAPYISSWELHQALTQVIHQRRPLSIEYCSPTISFLLHVHLLPTAEGVMVFVH